MPSDHPSDYPGDILDGIGTGHPAVSVGVGGQRGAARARRGGDRGGLGVRAADLAQGAVAAEIECSGSIGDDVLERSRRKGKF